MKYTCIFCNESSPFLTNNDDISGACFVHSDGDVVYYGVSLSSCGNRAFSEANHDCLVYSTQNDGIIGYRYTDNISQRYIDQLYTSNYY